MMLQTAGRGESRCEASQGENSDVKTLFRKPLRPSSGECIDVASLSAVSSVSPRITFSERAHICIFIFVKFDIVAK